MIYYIVVPYFEDEAAEEVEGMGGNKVIFESGFFAVFTCKENEVDEVTEKLNDMAIRGKLNEFIIIEDSQFKDAVPVYELFKVDREDDIDYLEGLIAL